MEDKEILEAFLEESLEHLDGIEQFLLELESDSSSTDPDVINAIFRGVHSIKGGAGLLGMLRLKDLSHAMENVLGKIREGKLQLSSTINDALLKGLDKLKTIFDDLSCEPQIEINDLVTELNKIEQSIEPEATGEDEEDTFSPDAPVLINSAANSNCMLVSDDDIILMFPADELEEVIKKQTENDRFYLLKIDKSIEENLEEKLNEIKELTLVIEHTEQNGFLYILISSMIEIELLGEFLNLELDNIHHVKTEIDWVLTDTDSESGKKFTSNKEEQIPITEATVEEPTKAPLPTPVIPQKTATTSQEDTVSESVSRFNKEEISTASIRVKLNTLDKLIHLAGELVLARNELQLKASNKQDRELNRSLQKLSNITRDLHEVVMETRMQPIGKVFNRFKRTTRDLARELGKQIQLTIKGSDVEIDQTVLERISDPLTHLIRNSIDHGIEMPEARMKVGKESSGHILLSAVQEAGIVLITIKDDGAGLNLNKIRDKAIERAIISREEAIALSEQELSNLIFAPGFSTAETINDLSGRGVGMDVVMSEIQSIGGSLELKSHAGKGMQISIRIPLTLTIMSCLLFKSMSQTYALANGNILELLRIKPNEIKDKIERAGHSFLLHYRNKVVPLISLSGVLADHDYEDLTCENIIYIIIVKTSAFEYALVVNEIIDASEIVVTPPGRHLQSGKIYSGSTVLGSGEVAFIIDPAGVYNSCPNSRSIEEDKLQLEHTEEIQQTSETQSLLLASTNQDKFAIPLSLVQRLEKIQPHEVQVVNGRNAIKYHNSTLLLFDLSETTKVSSVDLSRPFFLVTHRIAGRDAGIVFQELDDIVEIAITIDPLNFQHSGVFGSSVINEEITLIVDLHSLVAKLVPDWIDGSSIYKPATIESGSFKILVVEDSEFFSKHVCELLHSAGYETLTAMNGEEGLDQLNRNEGQVDLIITDIEMPKMDGFAFAEQVRHNPAFINIPIMAVTTIAGEEAEKKGKRVGMDDYLIKLDREQILQKTRHYLQHGRKH